jgi:ABC-2 type transport system ATP-binding protein
VNDSAISVRGLRKAYGAVEAVRGIDLDVGRGEVFALIGPNGAGKTTTVEVLEGFRHRDGGDVSVLGHDPARNERALKQRVGIVLQSTSVEAYLTVSEVIELFRGYYPHPRPLDELVEVVGLTEKRESPVRKLSGGQQRRLDVAIGLAGDPELLFLDEPTTGFDPSARRAAWGMIKHLQSLGKTVFLTTHYMDEAQELANRVAIIAEGRIVAEGTPAELMDRASGTKIAFRMPGDRVDLPEPLRPGALFENGRVVLETEEPTRALHTLTDWALKHQVDLDGLTVMKTSLEDVYLSLTASARGEEAAEP